MKLNPIGSNMTEVEIGNKVVLFSYKTPVAYRDEKGGFYRTSKHWSVTTSRHINKWLAEFGGVVAREMGQEFFDGLVA